MKTCSICKTDKDEEKFRWKNKAKGQRTTWCRTCYSDYEKKKWEESSERRSRNYSKSVLRRKRNAQVVWDHLTCHPCPCGESDPVVLEFDHRDPDTKRGNICEMASRGLALETIQEEIEKCDVLCANCHRRKTAQQFGWHADIKR